MYITIQNDVISIHVLRKKYDYVKEQVAAAKEISILVLRKKYDLKGQMHRAADIEFQSSYFVRSTTMPALQMAIPLSISILVLRKKYDLDNGRRIIYLFISILVLRKKYDTVHLH